MVEIIITFIAGIVSFVSPCVLPLVPAYIGYMGGRVTNTVSAQVTANPDGTAVASGRPFSARFNTFMHGIAFVSGFTFIFVALGVLSVAVLQQFGGVSTITNVIGRIGGIVIIFFGLHFMGIMPSIFRRIKASKDEVNPAVFQVSSVIFALLAVALFTWGFTGTLTPWNPSGLRSPETWTIVAAVLFSGATLVLMFIGGAFTDATRFWNKTINTVELALYADTRREMVAGGNQGFGGSALMGVVFAAGWTPCIGPTLGVALTLAGSSGADAARGGILLAAYSLGLGIPFLLTALMLDSAQGVLRRLQKRMRMIELVSGAFLVLIGVAIASGELQNISQRYAGEFADVSFRIEECVVGFFEGDVHLNQVGGCLSGDEVITDTDGASENTEAGVITTNTIEDIAASTDAVVGLRPGNIAPDFETVNALGDTVRLSDFRGQVVLLNFWYTTCPPCRIEMPDLQAAYEQYAEDGFVILAVNREESLDEITPFTDELGLTFPVLLDESGDIQVEYNVRGYPTTFVIDEDGIIQEWNPGFLTESQIEEFITDALS